MIVWITQSYSLSNPYDHGRPVSGEATILDTGLVHPKGEPDPTWLLLKRRPRSEPQSVIARSYCPSMAHPMRSSVYPLKSAQAHLGQLVAEARERHIPVMISEDGQPVAALISIDDLVGLEDLAALAAHLVSKAAGRSGTTLAELDAALDQIDPDS